MGGGGPGGRVGGQGGCERRIEVFLKIKKNNGGEGGGAGSGWGVRMDVNEELKFLLKIQKKNFGGRGVAGEGSGAWGLGWGRGQGGCE